MALQKLRTLTAEVEVAAAVAKANVKEQPADVGREKLGRLPSQDPPRQRLRPKL